MRLIDIEGDGKTLMVYAYVKDGSMVYVMPKENGAERFIRGQRKLRSKQD